MRPKVRGSEKLMASSRKISTQLVHLFGFSKGWRSCVVEAAAVGAEFLDRFLAGHRPAGDGLLGATECGDDLVVQVEVLDDTAGDQYDRRDKRQRQQDAHGAADQVHPEVTYFNGFDPDEAAHQGNRNGHAHRGGDEVLHGQAAICTR